MFAINFALIGARLLSFLSCLAYGKFGMTAVTRLADAVLHALIMMSSSIRWSLRSSPGRVVWRMKTSSSRTDSRMMTEVSWLEYLKTDMSRRGTPRLEGKTERSVQWRQRMERERRRVPVGDSLSEFRVGIAREEFD